MVIQDPNDKQNMKGFLHLRGFHLAYRGATLHHPNAYELLIVKMNEMTDIRTDFIGQFPLASSQIFLAPWAYLGIRLVSHAEANEAEKIIGGQYMLEGGFLFIFDWEPPDSRLQKLPTKDFVKEALATQGWKERLDL